MRVCQTPFMTSDPQKIVVEGITQDGQVFRPSDWIERLIGTLSTYGEDRRANPRPHVGVDRRRRQENFLQAQMINGSKCLVVDTRLREANPSAYRFLQDFIENNRLRILGRDDASPTRAESL